MIKVLIVDDHQEAIATLKELLESYDNYEVCGEALTLQTAIELTCIEKPDLVFLDILLDSTKTGFDYLNAFLPNVNFKVIFTTAYNEFAIKAFEFSALHYLLKPIDVETFDNALLKMNNLQEQRQYVDKLENLAKDLENSQHRFIFINTTEKVNKIDIKSLLFLEAKGNYTTLHLPNNKKITSAKTLLHYQKQLDKAQFFRVHHSYLINIAKVKSYQKKQNELVLENGVVLSVATRREKDFLEVWCKLR